MTSPRLRLAFMGTPDFAVPSLSALIDAGHDIPAVYTQPPRPAGRGHRERRSPVHGFAAGHGLQVHTPATLRDASEQAAFAALDLDAAVVAAYGLILPKPVLDAPRLGCLNVHASLLPRWRGAAPIHRAILAGDRESGVTIMQMDEGLDTGAMLLSQSVPIDGGTTTAVLHDRLAALGADLIVEALERAAAGTLEPVPQPEEGVIYAAKIGPADGRIDWSDADLVGRQVRALSPRPGAWFEFAGERLKVHAVEPASGAGVAGIALDDNLTVACAAGGAVRLLRLQRPGKAPMDAGDLLRGFAIPKGSRL